MKPLGVRKGGWDYVWTKIQGYGWGEWFFWTPNKKRSRRKAKQEITNQLEELDED